MAAARGHAVLREGAAAEVAGGCDPAASCCALPAADTEGCAEGQRPPKALARECPAPPPRRSALGRPLLSARGNTPSPPPAAQCGAPPDAAPDALHSPALAFSAVQDQSAEQPPSEVERLTREVQRLRAALAAAEATIRELTAALSAATAQAHSAAPEPAMQPAGGGAEEQKAPGGKRRNRKRHRPRGRRQQSTVPEEEGEERQDEERAREEGQADGAFPAGADPAPRRQQLGAQAAEEQGAARPPTPWADEWESQQDEEHDAAALRASQAAGPQSSTFASPPLCLSISPPTAAPTPALPEEACWVCSMCGVVKFHATDFCGNPRCRARFGGEYHPAPAAPQDASLGYFPHAQLPAGAQHAMSDSWPAAPADASGMEQATCYQLQDGNFAPLQCPADRTLAPPPQRQPPPRRVYAQPCSVPMLVPVHLACPPPVPEPADPRQALGEELHPRVAGLCPARANMITGMLLERGGSYAQLLIDDAQLLASEVLTAWQVLVAAEGPQSAQPTAPAPAASTPAQAPDSPRGQQKKPYIPSYLRRQPVVPAQPAAPTPAPAPAPPCGRRNEPYVAPFLRRRQRL
eukprot:TRINITY_DN14744_c0_g2_i1.p1 TRINITY_DN14744_c0_g2~~TRINITY_DN14744_c0_g2_i1.p1  ORF type:complete len:578 (+),score=115.43 TRINITY_DN14744_c0_g2_i1:66-1799(+)